MKNQDILIEEIVIKSDGEEIKIHAWKLSDGVSGFDIYTNFFGEEIVAASFPVDDESKADLANFFTKHLRTTE